MDIMGWIGGWGMKLESRFFSRDYAKEAVNVALMNRELIRDPHKKIGNHIVRWRSYQCLRMGNYGIYFIPKEREKGNIVGIPEEHTDAVLQYLEENGLRINKVYENPV